MLKSLKLSLRNLARYRTRTLITIIAVLISVLVSILVDGLIRGMFEISTYNLLSYESSEVTIYQKGYFEKRNEYPSDIFISGDELKKVSSKLEKANIAYTPRYKAISEIISYNEEADSEFYLNVILVGVDKEKDKNVFKISESIHEGTWFENEDEILLGSKIAEKLNLNVGDVVTLSTTGAMGFAETLDLVVGGIINSEDPQVNMSQVFVNLSDLDFYLSLEGGATEIALSDSLPSVASIKFKERVQQIIGPNLDARYYEEVNEDLIAIMNGDKGSSFIMLLFLFIIAAAGISNTMLMAAMERRKETAMLRSLGFSRKSIVTQFVLEGTITGIIGALIGAILALIVMIPLSKYGIDFTALLSEDMDIGYRIPLILRPGLYWQSFFMIPLLAVLLSAASAFFPVLKTGKEEIADLFRRTWCLS